MQSLIIEKFLRHTGQALTRRLRLEAGSWAGVCMFAGLALALLWAHVGLPTLALGTLIFGVLAAALVAFWLLRHSPWAHQGQGPVAQAHLVETLLPPLGTALRSAVDFDKRLMRQSPKSQEGALGFSEDLADAHVEATSKLLSGLSIDEPLRLYRWPYLRRALWALGGTALAALFGLGVLAEGRARLWSLVVNPSAVTLSDIPLAGDIRVVYTYPSYTGLAPRVLEGGDGSISALVGTRVEISARTDRPSRQASLEFQDIAGNDQAPLAMTIKDDVHLSAAFSVVADGRYAFALQTLEGERLRDRNTHPIQALSDAYPQVSLDQPATDIELKDDRPIEIMWQAKDDFGLSALNLVVAPKDTPPEALLPPDMSPPKAPGTQEGAGGEAAQPAKPIVQAPSEVIRVPLMGEGELQPTVEGRYRLSLSALGIEPGVEVKFFVEALDNDGIAGAKRSVSQTRHVLLFSATRHHEKLLQEQREILDAMVDLLAKELTNPVAEGFGAKDKDLHQGLLVEVTNLAQRVRALSAQIDEDTLSKPEIAAAFRNVAERLDTFRDRRAQALGRIVVAKYSTSARVGLAQAQAQGVAQLEKDIIYLDDLLALQRIEELKRTAKDLLASQRQLQDLLDEYRRSQDPALKAQLERQISELRDRMMQLLAKMAQIKKQLPGEYRNMESSSMAQMDDQMKNLEEMLQKGDLEAAAKELEGLANTIENMMNSIDKAEEEYGGERYDAMREELAEFAESFRQIEEEQKALAERTDKLLEEYRKKSVQQAGQDLDDVIKKARKKTAQALEELDRFAEVDPLNLQERTQIARQRLLDTDALLAQKDLAEAREEVAQALREGRRIDQTLQNWNDRFRGGGEVQKAIEAHDASMESAQEVQELLEKLFPDPQDVMNQRQMEQLQRMAQRQQDLQKQAQELQQQMQSMAGEMPIFGGDNEKSLEQAGREMGDAAGNMRGRRLPNASKSERRALDHLGKLRQSLEQASQQGGGGGIPLPMGGGRPGGKGSGQGFRSEDVNIPKADRQGKGPAFREELMDAAKQKAPAQYEDAVKQYYKELIR